MVPLKYHWLPEVALDTRLLFASLVITGRGVVVTVTVMPLGEVVVIPLLVVITV